ncbi:MAG: lamin tail domain-containing protein [Ignavibacteriae bacterium]|nr:lamin tail domain-containing protein [Ignavibacteriota bacterium]
MRYDMQWTFLVFLIVLMLSCISCDEPLQPSSFGTSKLSIVINEFLASNTQTNIDEAGEYDDWIELYNTSDSSVLLQNIYLTDSLNYPNRWRMPDTTIAPRGYLLVWTDNQPQGKLHATFRLDKEGEQIGIFVQQDGEFSVIDSLTFRQQRSDTSYGRFPDGESQWSFFPAPTPGAGNR